MKMNYFTIIYICPRGPGRRPPPRARGLNIPLGARILNFLRNVLFPSGVDLGGLVEQPFPSKDLPIALPGALLLDVGFLMQQYIRFQNIEIHKDLMT